MLITRSPEATEAPTTIEAPSAMANLMPLIIDIAVPLGTYYVMRYAMDTSLVTAYGVSSFVPVVRTLTSAIRDRRVNALAALMLAVNVVGVVLTLVTGDVRLMMAKDSGISSVIAFSILFSVLRGRPLMTAGLKPWITKGDTGRIEAWERLAATSPAFRRYEIRFSLIWGAALLAECVARFVGAFTLPVSTMSGLSTACTVTGIAIAVIVSGGAASAHLDQLVTDERGR